ncbi:exopolyphosphatase [Arthrospiribacter ruber]|uniref:Exopolyphosphatase n=1 Tax=Arthrospiribacter ruber TaxID=2487934 RepID=A0A951MIR2_9BACT|nr:exopolyphosphatase [Arthrospiribacter ruber]MBW3470425.1 exopolyphosphatase [Arthrospiribacter ruber]
MNPNKAAIIDMGTNTFHLLLVNLYEDRFETIFKEKIPVKIGQGGITHNTIHPEAQKRAFHTIRHFRNMIDGEGIINVFAFATSAVRNATNGPAFVEEIKDKFDIKVNVIDGDEEALMIYEGIRFSGSLNGQTSLMMDIGGGSVEFIIGTAQEAFWRKSFEIGGQRMLDLFHYHDPILTEETENLTFYLEEKLADLRYAIEQFKPTALVGASGTFDTLTDIYFQSLHQEKNKKQQVFELPVASFEIIAEKLLTLNKAERLKIPGMIPMRVDMIVVASCLIKYILQLVPVTALTCSNYALKEGAIARLIGKHSFAAAES